MILHNTPLHPSPFTPIAYSKVNLDTKLNKLSNTAIIPETANLFALFSQYQESNFALFESLLIERGTEKTQNIFNLVVFNSKFNSLKSEQKLNYIRSKFDINDLVREYDINEQLPTWFCESYVGQDKIRKMRTQMKRKLNEKLCHAPPQI